MRRPNGNRGSIEADRATLAERLRHRSPELQASVAAKVHAISNPRETADLSYITGLRESLSVALEYGLATLECGEMRAPAVPPRLLVQARTAARNHVRLDTVLRRYFAGYSLLTEFVIQEAEESGLINNRALQELLLGQATVFDRLLAAVVDEYRREIAASERPALKQRRAERVERLLAGDQIDATELNYVLEGSHIAVIGKGSDASVLIREFASSLDALLLLVSCDGGEFWAWLGSREPFAMSDLDDLRGLTVLPQSTLAFGEPAAGLDGWRLSHHQARAAFSIANNSDQRLVRYADVALLASTLQDDLLTTSLERLYLAPLAQERDGGEALCEALRAYFASGRNISSAAAALGVNRRTVSKRLRAVERILERPIDLSTAELEAALRLQQFRFAGTDS